MVIAPADGRIFSAQSFAFATTNESSAIDLLARSEADGGGHTGYNMALTPGATVRGWFGIDGRHLGSDATGATPHFRSRGFSVSGGADASLAAAGRIGVAVGYDDDRFRDSAGGKGSSNSVRASVYASQPFGPIGLSALLGYAHSWQKTDRETGIGRAHASHGVTQWIAGVQAAAPFQLGGVTATPAVGAITSRLSGDDFRETGSVPAAFRISGSPRTRSFVSPYATLGLASSITSASGVVWIPDVELGYRYSNAARGSAVTLVAADGTEFDGNRTGLNRASALLGASLTAHQGRWTGVVRYRGQIADGWSDHSATVGFRFAF